MQERHESLGHVPALRGDGITHVALGAVYDPVDGTLRVG